MPDCDWVRYRQMRGRPLPERIEHRGTPYVLERVFKRDFYAATGQYRRDSAAVQDGPEHVVYKTYHLDPLWKIIPLRWLGRWLFRRERYFGRLLADVHGIAHVIGRHGKSGLIREYVPGMDLRKF